MKSFLKYFLAALVIFSILIIILGQTSIGNKYQKESGPHFSFIGIEDNTIRYLQKGKGKDLLLIHGTPGSIEDWNSIIDELSLDYRVTAFDRLGHGFSTAKGYKYHISENATLVKKLIDQLKLKSPIIVGHSYGGSVAANLAANHYDDSLKYVIIDSPLFDYEPSTIYKLVAMPIIGKGFAFLANFSIAENMIESGVREAFSNQTDEQIKEHIETRKKIWLQPKVSFSKAKESINYQIDLKQQEKKYASISANCFLITGKDSTNTFRLDAEKFSETISTDSLLILDNTSHYVQIDQYQKVLSFLKNI